MWEQIHKYEYYYYICGVCLHIKSYHTEQGHFSKQSCHNCGIVLDLEENYWQKGYNDHFELVGALV
jgi:hypothetical protein